MPDDALRRMDALMQVALRLARSAPSGRVALAQLARRIELEWIPRPRGESLAAELQAASAEACKSVPAPRIERALRDAWGVPAAQELDELDPEPAAITPTSQVHRALLEGRPVAVKVLRPRLAGSIRQDLSLLEALATPLAAAFPALDVGASMREVRERVLEELDLEMQAATQRRFHRALRDHPLFTAPAPITRLSHHAVLVSEWLDGVPLAAARNRDDAAARLVLFVLGAARWGTIPADLDPEDVLVQGDGRIAILDFGSVRSVEPGRLAQVTLALEAFADDDVDALAAALERLAWLPAARAPIAAELARQALGRLAGPEPARLDSQAVIALRDRLLARPHQLLEVVLSGTLAPADLWPARGVAALFGTIARAGATGPWLELVRAGLREGWDARPPG